jgi:hypothetical protein
MESRLTEYRDEIVTLINEGMRALINERDKAVKFAQSSPPSEQEEQGTLMDLDTGIHACHPERLPSRAHACHNAIRACIVSNPSKVCLQAKRRSSKYDKSWPILPLRWKFGINKRREICSTGT